MTDDELAELGVRVGEAGYAAWRRSALSRR